MKNPYENGKKSVFFEIPYFNSVWCQKSVFVRINPYIWQHWSCDVLYQSIWNFYSVSSNTKPSSPIDLVSFRSLVTTHEFRETYFWDDPCRYNLIDFLDYLSRYIDYLFCSPEFFCFFKRSLSLCRLSVQQFGEFVRLFNRLSSVMIVYRLEVKTFYLDV